MDVPVMAKLSAACQQWGQLEMDLEYGPFCQWFLLQHYGHQIRDAGHNASLANLLPGLC